MKYGIFAAAFCLLVTPSAPSWGVCPPSCPIPGGGDAATDCHAEFAATALRLNYPPFDPKAPAPATEVRCFDGDAGCDTDGAVDGACTFQIDVCLRNADPELASCTPANVDAVTVEAGSDPQLVALQTALDGLLPATENVCTTGQRLRVPLGDDPGASAQSSKTVRLEARTSDKATDADELELTCVPRGWPSHGYTHANHRFDPLENTLSPENAAQLAVKWHLSLNAVVGGGHSVTGTPTIGNGLLYVGSRNVYAVDPDTAEIRWSHPTEGIQGTPTLTADGRLLVGDGEAIVHCLDAVSGKVLWQEQFGDPSVDHMWASPAIANNRVIIGMASHSDNPCTQGRLVAADLDTGELLWTIKTVPDRVCTNDTAMECEANTDCGGGTCVDGACDNDGSTACDQDDDCGPTCVAGRGAGVTATVAIDPSGETVFMNTVGCYTFPSIGDSDSIFRIKAATGEVEWMNRVQPPEQFGSCQANRSIDCGSDEDCDGGSCQVKGAYHDFGFLNGPLLLPAEAGPGGTQPLVASGSKDGTLYAFNPETGEIVWTNEVVPTPVTPGFAGFGLFNGAVAYANQRLYAALYFTIPPADPEPQHLMAFDSRDGATVWSDEIGRSWSHVTVVNNLLFAGTRDTVSSCERSRAPCAENEDCSGERCLERSPFYIYDARDGTRLKEIEMPSNVVGGPSVAGDTIYVPYGVAGTGGVVALSLPGCPGDCNRDGNVRVDELVRAVNVALDQAAVDTCFAADRNTDWRITVNELVSAVSGLLQGCPG